MKFNYAKLLGRMRELNYTQETLAKAIGRNEGTLNAKLNNRANFTGAEIFSICEVLKIASKDIGSYFFAV
jgi:DNA-binding XRE family transcriptional regulator